MTKLCAHQDLASFDNSILTDLAAACGYGHASSEGAVAVYVEEITNFNAANSTVKKVGARWVSVGDLSPCPALASRRG